MRCAAYNASPQTPAILRIPLPAAFNTLNDILSLPLQSFTLGIGDPRVPEENGGTTRTSYTARLYVQDTWRLRQRLTLNYGLAWNVDRNQNYDLSKPALLAPILGADGLGPTRKQWKNFSPSLGLAWSPARDEKTVIRAGAGIFYDFLCNPTWTPSGLRSDRRVSAGRISLEVQFAIRCPIFLAFPLGTPLDFSRTSPTLFTGADLMAILPSIRTGLQQKLASGRPVGARDSNHQAGLQPTVSRRFPDAVDAAGQHRCAAAGSPGLRRERRFRLPAFHPSGLAPGPEPFQQRRGRYSQMRAVPNRTILKRSVRPARSMCGRPRPRDLQGSAAARRQAFFTWVSVSGLVRLFQQHRKQ